MQKLLVSLLGALAVLIVAESSVRLRESSAANAAPSDTAELLRHLETARIQGREIGNQTLTHNIALFSRYPAPETVTSAYVGTSRTKILRPEWYGISNAVNGSGNSYNEITYGLLLQAEILRLRFPNLRRVYFEASLLLRRPPRLVLEQDHRKYLPLLKTLSPLREQLPGKPNLREEIARFEATQGAGISGLTSLWPLHVIEHRDDLRFYKLLMRDSVAAESGIPALEDGWIANLKPNGERRQIPAFSTPKKDQKPEITNDHIKVQRLREIPGWSPWDGLYDVIALWGQEHNIEIILFEPPVRSDLYQFQLRFGLTTHNDDLKRVAQTYDIPFIDLNQPQLGYMDDWTLYSDEDHLETCLGILLLQTALEEGRKRFLENHDLLPMIDRDTAEEASRNKKALCHG